VGRIGRYEVTGVIGWGGMGVVLRAIDGTLRRTVAVKVIAPALATNATARRRFLREAQAAAAIRHEHVVTIHAVEGAEALPHIVMEYVPGVSLQERLQRTGPLALREILRVGVQTASGLAAAHALGMVHRDVKPANILLERGSGRVKLTDFGLARAAGDPSLTQSGVLVGTPEYMAPEQAGGEAADHRADLFSLGAVLYAMCTGRSPFRAGTTLAVLRRVCEDTPVPIRRLNPEIPGWLVRVVGRLLAKDPADRFQSAEEVADLLGRHLDALAEERAPRRPASSATRRLARPRRGSRVGLAVGLSLLLVLVVASAITAVVIFAGDSPEPAEHQDNVAGGAAALGPEPPNGEPPRPNNPDLRLALVSLKADNAHTRREAAMQLQKMTPVPADRATVARALEPLLNDPDHFARQAMIGALGVWGTRESVPALVKMFQHEDVFTRRAALTALGNLRYESSAEAVAGRLDKGLNRHYASLALQAMGPLAEKATARMIGHNDWTVRLEVCKILKVIGTKQSIPALETGVRDANGIVAAEARAALQAVNARALK
jgi:HEAT repeat protein